MKNIDFISDIHINFIFGDKLPTDRLIRLWFDDVFKTKTSDTLIIAGDIGVNVLQSLLFLTKVVELYDYKTLLFTFGNHDLWLQTRKQIDKYKKNSFKKMDEMRSHLSEYNKNSRAKIYLLDGTMYEVDGIKIGGAMGWYDSSYYDSRFNTMYTSSSAMSVWKNRFNDSKNIYPIREDYYWITNQEKEKVLNVLAKKPDIMVTHVCPISSDTVVSHEYKNDITNTFYMFDGLDLIYEYKPKVWIYGHMHGRNSININGTALVRNAHGYPQEYDIQEVQSIVL